MAMVENKIPRLALHFHSPFLSFLGKVEWSDSGKRLLPPSLPQKRKTPGTTTVKTLKHCSLTTIPTS